MYNYFCTSRASAPVTIRAWNRLTKVIEARRFHSGREQIDRRSRRATNADAANMQAVRLQ
jgi:hypothetical protein